MSQSDPRPVVLTVEDEALIRMCACDILAEAGFEPLEAGHGREALATLECRADVAVLFSDYDMPVMDGFTLARLVAARWPQIGILMTSGKVAPSAGELPARARFLPKPYNASALVSEIRGVLDVLQVAERFGRTLQQMH